MKIIAKHAADFFDEKSIMIAKSDLWSRVFVGERVPRRQGDLANYRHIKDIIETFQKCESDDFILPTYVIILPNRGSCHSSRCIFKPRVKASKH